MDDKRTFWIIAIGIVVYFIYKKGKTVTGTQDDNSSDENMPSDTSSERLFGTSPANICIPPPFTTSTDFSGRQCAGQYIDETKNLKLGDFGCDVLLLQQRLNSIQTTNILPPNGRFDCKTLNKLRNVKGVNSMRLDMFQPDEEIGFNSLQPTKVTNFNYSYMDIDKKI